TSSSPNKRKRRRLGSNKSAVRASSIGSGTKPIDKAKRPPKKRSKRLHLQNKCAHSPAPAGLLAPHSARIRGDVQIGVGRHLFSPSKPLPALPRPSAPP